MHALQGSLAAQTSLPDGESERHYTVSEAFEGAAGMRWSQRRTGLADGHSLSGFSLQAKTSIEAPGATTARHISARRASVLEYIYTNMPQWAKRAEHPPPVLRAGRAVTGASVSRRGAPRSAGPSPRTRSSS